MKEDTGTEFQTILTTMCLTLQRQLSENGRMGNKDDREDLAGLTANGGTCR